MFDYDYPNGYIFLSHDPVSYYYYICMVELGYLLFIYRAINQYKLRCLLFIYLRLIWIIIFGLVFCLLSFLLTPLISSSILLIIHTLPLKHHSYHSLLLYSSDSFISYLSHLVLLYRHSIWNVAHRPLLLRIRMHGALVLVPTPTVRPRPYRRRLFTIFHLVWSFHYLVLAHLLLLFTWRLRTTWTRWGWWGTTCEGHWNWLALILATHLVIVLLVKLKGSFI